jgi:hypothetical protein
VYPLATTTGGVDVGLPTTANFVDYVVVVQIGPEGTYKATITCNNQISNLVVTVKQKKTYAGLGDSYSSGEGADTFDSGTDSATNRCHRAPTAWAHTVANRKSQSLDFAACSGGLIDDFYTYNGKNYVFTGAKDTSGNQHEVPQLDHVSPSVTKLATLSVGGNNVGFPDVITDCVYGLFAPGSQGCSGRDQKTISTVGWFKFLQNGRPAGCFAVPGRSVDSGKPEQLCSKSGAPALHQLYEDVALRLAPAGTLIVAGYPELFGNDATLHGCVVGTALVPGFGFRDYTVSAEDASWLNEKALELNNIIGKEIRAARTALATTRPDVTLKFASGVDSEFGGHRLCDPSSWINGIVFSGVIPHPDQRSFHPTSPTGGVVSDQNGQGAYARAVLAAP